MNKKEYLDSVQEELAGLKLNLLNREMKKLNKKIEKLEAKKIPWSEIKKKLGDYKEYAEKVLVKYEKDPIEWLSLLVARTIRSLTDWVQEFASMLSDSKLKDLIHTIVVLFLIFIIALFLKFPFLILSELIQSITNIFHISISSVIQIGLKETINLCYCTTMFVMIVWMIQKYIVEYFQAKKKLSFETKENQKLLEKLFKNMASVVTIIYKIISFFFLIPFLIVTLFFLIVTIVSIALVINKTGYIYVIISAIGLTIFYGSILLFLATFVFQKRHHTWQKLKYCLLGIVILVVSFAIMPIEYLGYTKIDHNVLLEENSITKNFTIESDDISKIEIYNNGEKNHINYIVDNNIDRVVVEVIYPSQYYNLALSSYENSTEMKINYQTNLKAGKGYELFGKIFYYYITKTEQKLRYSYTNVNFPDITVRANEENMKKIVQD